MFAVTYRLAETAIDAKAEMGRATTLRADTRTRVAARVTPVTVSLAACIATVTAPLGGRPKASDFADMRVITEANG